MSDFSARNVEREVLQSATDKLQKACRNSLKSLAGKFYADSLITTDVKRSCSDGSVDRDTCTESLVSTLQDRVSNEPSAYYKIVKILESETGVSYIVKSMEDKRMELKAVEDEKKAEFERIKASEQREVELRNRNLQENSDPMEKLFFLPGRPDTLPGTPMSSNAAPSRRVSNQLFHSNTGPAMYSKSFTTASSFSKSQNSSSTQLGDTFPLPASSPGDQNFW